MDVAKSVWREDQIKMFLQGVKDNSTVVTFSVKVYYTVDVAERAGGRITDMVNAMIDSMNKKFEKHGVLAKVELHCLEEMTWTEKDVVSKFANYDWYKGPLKGLETYKYEDRNSADAVFYVATQLNKGINGFATIGAGLSKSFSFFDSRLRSWMLMEKLSEGYLAEHELGHNLGNRHLHPKAEYDNRTMTLIKRFRFALAAVGDEKEPCPKQDAAWEFRFCWE